MQIILVWFQYIQWLKKKKTLIDNQRNTICFQEIARVFQNVKIFVQTYTYSSYISTSGAYISMRDEMAQAEVACVGKSKAYSFIHLSFNHLPLGQYWFRAY